MCPACLTSLALTVATTTGAGAAATAFVVRTIRAVSKNRKTDNHDREELHDHVEPNRHT